MGTTAEKLNYAINATNEIAEGINNIGGNITQNTELADFRDELDKLYNEMPKVTQSGTSITLANTRRGKITITPKGNTKQETTEGYNLINLDNGTKTDRGITGTITEHSILSWEGAAISSYANITYEQNINLPIGTYTFSIDKVTPNNERVVIYLRGATTQSVVIQRGRTFVTVTTTEEKTVCWVGISNLVADNNYNGEVKLMFESGSVAHDYEQYTGGMPSPNPDYPQDIKVVTGENDIIIRGKNLANWESGDISSDNGQDVSTQSAIQNAIRTTNYIPLSYGDTISEWHNFEMGLNIRLYDANKNYLGYATFSSGLFTNTNQNATYVRFRASHSKSNTDKIIIAYSNVTLTENDFEPYIEPIEKKLNLTSKNLFNKNGNIINNYRLSTTGGNFLNNGYFISEFIPIKPSTTYSVNYTPDAYSRICYYTSNTGNPEHSFISKNDANSTFTTPNNAKYLRFCNLLTEIDTIQLEKGSNATPYEAYYAYELAKIGDYSDLIFKNEKTNPYYDNTLIENAWYEKKIINSRLYNGTESFQLGSASNDNYYIFQTAYRYDLADKDMSINNAFADKFVCVGTEQGHINANQEQIAFNNNAQTYVRFTISASRLTEKSISAFQTWLSLNNVLIYYVLANPVNIQITDATLINQLEEINSIIGTGGTVVIETESGNENAQLIVNASALASFENG